MASKSIEWAVVENPEPTRGPRLGWTTSTTLVVSPTATRSTSVLLGPVTEATAVANDGRFRQWLPEESQAAANKHRSSWWRRLRAWLTRAVGERS